MLVYRAIHLDAQQIIGSRIVRPTTLSCWLLLINNRKCISICLPPIPLRRRRERRMTGTGKRKQTMEDGLQRESNRGKQERNGFMGKPNRVWGVHLGCGWESTVQYYSLVHANFTYYQSCTKPVQGRSKWCFGEREHDNCFATTNSTTHSEC